jgi:hypothetical protein
MTLNGGGVCFSNRLQSLGRKMLALERRGAASLVAVISWSWKRVAKLNQHKKVNLREDIYKIFVVIVELSIVR